MKALMACVCLFAVVGCAEASSSDQRFQVRVNVVTDTGEPVAAAALAIDGQAVGVMDDQGARTVDVVGREGRRLRVSVVCPHGFRANHQPRELVLRRVASLRTETTTSARDLTLHCLPNARRGVLVVRTSGATRLPVLVDGKVLAHTNEQGIAHVSVTLVPDTKLRVGLDTSAFPTLTPANPSQVFVVDDRDAILAFDQALAEVKPTRRSAKRGRGRELPYRLD